MQRVNFFSAEVSAKDLKGKQHLRPFILTLFESEKKAIQSVNYIFCSDDYLLKINQKYLKHDFYTDVITFNLSESELITGEVYISVSRVRENAQQLNLTFSQELARVVFHGALHLCGYRDKTKREITIMRAKEELYLQSYLNFINNSST